MSRLLLLGQDKAFIAEIPLNTAKCKAHRLSPA